MRSNPELTVVQRDAAQVALSRFRSRRAFCHSIKVRRAPFDEDVQWRNLEYKYISRAWRRFLAFLSCVVCVLIMLGVNAAFIKAEESEHIKHSDKIYVVLLFSVCHEVGVTRPTSMRIVCSSTMLLYALSLSLSLA